MEPTLRKAYWQDLAARRAFIDFIREIHRIDFSAWNERGWWDDDYSPYSYFLDGRVIASLCIYTMPARVNGKAERVAQVSGVGTLEAFRKQGLNRRLHEIALEESRSRHRWFFLFADDDAVPFYRKCGFRPVDAHAVIVPMPPVVPDRGIEKLDLKDRAVLDGIYRLACLRAPPSQVFSTANPKLVMWQLLYRIRDHAWRIPSLDAVIFMRRDGGKTIVYDILAPAMPRFEQLAPFLAEPEVREIDFRFPVDQLDVPSSRLRVLPGHNAHVMGDFDLGDQPVFPFTSEA
jgi:GNAT superfamily N-acetyltransferase